MLSGSAHPRFRRRDCGRHLQRDLGTRSVAPDVQIDDFARPRIPNPFIKIQETSHAKPIDTDYKVIVLVKRDRPDKWSDYYRRWKHHHTEHRHTIQYITDRLTVWMQSCRGSGAPG